MPRVRNPSQSTFLYCVGVAIVASGALAAWGMPVWTAYLVSISAITFACFGWDKRQAKNSKARIPETCLHALALIGGSIGSYAGQQTFRHKRAKKEFQKWFWGIVAIQIVALIAFAFLRSRS